VALYERDVQGKYDYFYAGNAGNTSDYKFQGIQFKLAANNNGLSDFIPIYSYSNPGVSSMHFYTTNSNEIGATTVGASGRYGYVYQGILGYISTNPLPNTKKLLRFYIASENNAHFYCLEGSGECDKALGNPGKYSAEGFLGYAYSP
jgi:hypothetical protein